MPLYYTKQNLYREIDNLRAYIGLSEIDFPILIRNHLEHQSGIKIQDVPFSTSALRGISAFGENDKCDVILLNSCRSSTEQNFDCAHEAVHLGLHRNEHKDSFTCFDNVTNKQDSFLEWHANEGGAELIVPHRDFIPRFLQELQSLRENPESIYDVRVKLAEFYHVSYHVIENRINNLGYEIDQYASGIDMDSLQILSRKQQYALGITPTAYNSVCDSLPFELLEIIG